MRALIAIFLTVMSQLAVAIATLPPHRNLIVERLGSKSYSPRIPRQATPPPSPLPLLTVKERVSAGRHGPLPEPQSKPRPKPDDKDASEDEKRDDARRADLQNVPDLETPDHQRPEHNPRPASNDTEDQHQDDDQSPDDDTVPDDTQPGSSLPFIIPDPPTDGSSQTTVENPTAAMAGLLVALAAAVALLV
ncbi:hypothetical protein GGR54DRAFT_594158 [Hypoxylon sp. NC1633]|nr:hypothetical protein GGR54DRAFT_594158 [Hypoxylon sp. NC1633]